MTISDMALPDDVVEKVARALVSRDSTAKGQADLVWHVHVKDAKTAIRAALQAMLDNGMATIVNEMSRKDWGDDKIHPIFILRLDADERKRAVK